MIELYLCVFRWVQYKKSHPPLLAAVPVDDFMWSVGPNQGLENNTQDCGQFISHYADPL